MSAPAYRLSKQALRELAGIITQTHRERGPAAANLLESRFFQAFRDLGQLPEIGHRRTDLTSKKVLFYAVQPFVIVFRRRGQEAHVVRVVHSARDIVI